MNPVINEEKQVATWLAHLTLHLDRPVELKIHKTLLRLQAAGRGVAGHIVGALSVYRPGSEDTGPDI